MASVTNSRRRPTTGGGTPETSRGAGNEYPSTDEVETEFAQVKRNVETASTTLQQEIDDLDARVKTMQADLDEQTAWRQQLRAAVTTTDSDGEVPSEQ